MSESPLREAMIKFGNDVLDQARINIAANRRIKGKKAQRVASGNLKNDLTFTFWKRGKVDQIIFTTKTKKTREYADVIEEGRTPGSKPPPTEAILKWMKLKKIRLRSREEGKKGQFIKAPKLKLTRTKDKAGKKRVKATASEYNSAAWLIARSIGVNGIEGIHYMRDAINATWDDYDEIFSDALQAEIQIRLKSDKYIKE
jgi:hypothetical protein